MIHDVRLTWYEISLGARCGVNRRLEGLRRNGSHGDFFGISNQADFWTRDIEGACAELAYAKWRNIFWDGSVNNFGKIDIDSVQVKSSYRHTKMRVRPQDSGDVVYVFIHCRSPVYRIMGYMKGSEAKSREFYMTPERGGPKGPPFYWIPAEKMHQLPLPRIWASQRSGK